MINVAINGFGRIGRALLRLSLNCSDIKISHIYDIKNFEILAYLLANDSLLKNFKGKIEYKKDKFFVNGNEIKITNDFSGADIVVECSGANLSTKSLQSYLRNGAKRVILSAPPKDNMPIFIYGVNWQKYRGEAIFSSASCTSNAIAPIIYTIAKKYKILGGNISTIHPFNSDQNLLDNPHAFDKRLSRNATQNIIPTSSSIGAVLEKVLCEGGESKGESSKSSGVGEFRRESSDFNHESSGIFGRFYGDSIRVPTSLVCFSNVDLLLDVTPTLSDILDLKFDKKIIAFDDEMRVSSDFVGDSHSAIIPKDLIKINGNILRIGLWFDNESGYVSRMLNIISELGL